MATASEGPPRGRRPPRGEARSARFGGMSTSDGPPRARRAPWGGRARRASGGCHPVIDERAVRVPQLAHDLGGRQVAVEALPAGGAERAVERAARLRRHAQRPAVVLGDVHGLDRVPGTDVEQPLARAVGRRRVAHDRGPANLGGCRELLAEALRQVGHRVDVAGEALVHPVQHLLRAKRLLAHGAEERGEAGGVEVEEIGHRSEGMAVPVYRP